MKAVSGQWSRQGFFQERFEADRFTASSLIRLGIFECDTFDLLINFISSIRSDGRKRDRRTDEQESGETKPELRTGSRGLRKKLRSEK